MENPKHHTDAPATGKTKVEEALEAQQEQHAVVAQKRVDYLKALDILQKIGGTDDIEQSIVAIVNAFPEGIQFPFLTQAIPEAKSKHREKLVREGVITQEKKGQSYILKPAIK